MFALFADASSDIRAPPDEAAYCFLRRVVSFLLLDGYSNPAEFVLGDSVFYIFKGVCVCLFSSLFFSSPISQLNATCVLLAKILLSS